MIDQPSNLPPPDEADVTDLLKRRAELLKALQNVEARLSQRLPVQQQRDLALRPLRGSVQRHGDIVSPTGERWEAQQ